MKKKTSVMLTSMMLMGLAGIAWSQRDCAAGAGQLSDETTKVSLSTDDNPVDPGQAAQEVTADMERRFQEASVDFSIKLLQENVEDGTNCMISPTSVLLALSMTANGANGDTRVQMEKVLAGGLHLDELNLVLGNWYENLPSTEETKISIANSIWIKDEETMQISEGFLQKNQQYYGAELYCSPFDEQTLADINSWVAAGTDGMIPELLSKINPGAIMYLMNAVAFDATWQEIYDEYQVYEEEFTAEDGMKETAQMMHSTEYQYLSDEHATGFIKSYQGGYAFAAILPEEGMTIEDYLNQWSGEKYRTLIEHAENSAVFASLPKFTAEYDSILNKSLIDMGMTDLFDEGKADLSGMLQDEGGGLYVNEVYHKTFIAVDELGTKAGAATDVEVMEGCAEMAGETVTLNRPFLYVVMEEETGIPIFIGVQQHVE